MSGEQTDIFLSLSRKRRRTPALCTGSYLMSALGFCDIHPSPVPLPSLPFPSAPSLLFFCLETGSCCVASNLPFTCSSLLSAGVYCNVSPYLGSTWIFFSALSIWGPFTLDSSEAGIFAESLAPGTLLLGSVVQDPILHGLPLLCLSQYFVCLSFCLFDTSCHQQPA